METPREDFLSTYYVPGTVGSFMCVTLEFAPIQMFLNVVFLFIYLFIYFCFGGHIHSIGNFPG